MNKSRRDRKGIYALTPQERMSVVWLTKKDIIKMLQISLATLNNWSSTGYFPKPVKCGRRCLWHPNVIDNWLLDQMEKK